jgi:hypothetical protein
MRRFQAASSGIVGAVKAASPIPSQLASGCCPPTDQRAQRFDADVCGEHEEGDGEQLLGASLRRVRAETRAGEQPQDDKAGKRLDQ